MIIKERLQLFASRAVYYSMGSSYGTDNSDEDCPLCRKFGTGPCATFFRKWRQCTSRNVDDYVEECANEFQLFQDCVESNEKFYSAQVPPGGSF